MEPSPSWDCKAKRVMRARAYFSPNLELQKVRGGLEEADLHPHSQTEGLAEAVMQGQKTLNPGTTGLEV